jgi:hypothetical protein
MTGWLSLMVVWAAITALGVAVIAGFAVSARMRRKAEDERLAQPEQVVPVDSLRRPPPDQPAEVVPQQSPPSPTSTEQPTPPASVSNAELRRWARSSGLQVADRGPIPRHVREAWATAHQS